jgi:hypothetical protein
MTRWHRHSLGLALIGLGFIASGDMAWGWFVLAVGVLCLLVDIK